MLIRLDHFWPPVFSTCSLSTTCEHTPQSVNKNNISEKGYQLTQAKRPFRSYPDEGLKTSNSKKVHKTHHDMLEKFLGSSALTNNGLTGESNAKYREEFHLPLFGGCELVLFQSSAISCYHPRCKTCNINICDSLDGLLFYWEGVFFFLP